MAGRGEGRGGGSGQIWLRGAIVVFVIAAALGLFSGQNGLQRPELSALNIAGIVVMVLGLAVTLLAARIADMLAEKGQEVGPFVRMAGVLICGVGAAMVFI